MTAHELAALLLDGPNLEVVFSYNCGDHWGTLVTDGCDDVEPKQLVYSDYHGKYTVPDSQSGLAHENADIITAIVIY